MDRNLLYSTRNSTQYSIITYMGKESGKDIYIYIYAHTHIYMHTHTHIHTRSGVDCGSDHQLLIEKFRLKLKKMEKLLEHSGKT